MVEMPSISTNPKPTIYRNLYENTAYNRFYAFVSNNNTTKIT